MGGITTIIMADPALIRLFSWLSPAFPIGGFAYSQGLETAIVDGRVRTREALEDWIGGQLHAGAMRIDASFLAIAARAIASGDSAAVRQANELALALQVSAERDRETREQARSFLDAAAVWPLAGMTGEVAVLLDAPMALPVAFGTMAGLHGIAPDAAVSGFINAAVAQQISVAVRLVPLGQSAGLAVLAGLEPAIAALAGDALAAGLEDIGGLAYGTDIASFRHEDLATRIFRS